MDLLNLSSKDSSTEGSFGTFYKDIFKDALKYSPSKILAMIGNILVVSIYTSLLTPSQLGLYYLSIGVMSFFLIMFSDWVGLSALRFFREHLNSNNVSSYFTTVLFLLATNLGLLYFINIFGFDSIAKLFKVPSDYFYIVLLLIIPVALRAMLFQVLRAQIKPMSYTISVIINQFSTIALAVFFIKTFNVGSKGILFGMAGSIAFIDFVMLFLTKMLRNLKINAVDFNVLKGFYKYGVPIGLAGLGMWFINHSNKFVLQHFIGSSSNGIVGVGFGLTYSIILPLAAIITLAAIPRIYNKYEEGVDVKPLISKMSGFYFILFAPVLIIFTVYAKDIVLLFANSKYQDAHIVLPLLAVSVFFFGLTEYTTIQYQLAKKTYINTAIKLGSGVIGLILSLVLIPKLGIIAVGISTLVSQFLYLVASILINVNQLNWIVPIGAIKLAFVSLIPAGITSYALAQIVDSENNFIFTFKVAIVVLVYSIVAFSFYKKKIFD